MNPAAALVGALLLASEGAASLAPDYPIGPLRFPALTAAGDRLTLTDVQYIAAQDSSAGTIQTLGARVRLGRWAIVGAEVDDQRRSASLETHRLDLGLAEEGGTYDLTAGFRGRRFGIHTDASRRTPNQGKSWIIDSEASWRFDPDLEITAGYLGDTDPARSLGTRTTRRVSLGAFYQRGAALDVGVDAWRSHIRTQAGLTEDLDHYSVSGAGLAFDLLQWDGEAGFEKTTGPFAHREGFVNTSGLVVLYDRVLAQGTFATSWEPGVARFEQELRASLTYTARNVHLQRAGESGRRTVELTRKAWDLGYAERRIFDLDGRRALRERLALSPRRAEMQDEIDALYRAQVAERNVLQMGIETERTFNEVRGTTGRSYRVFVAVPWPAAWPWTRNENSVAFLRATYIQAQTTVESGFRTVNREASLEIALNREMSLFFRWSKGGLSVLDVIRSQPRSHSLQVQYVYALGR